MGEETKRGGKGKRPGLLRSPGIHTLPPPPPGGRASAGQLSPKAPQQAPADPKQPHGGRGVRLVAGNGKGDAEEATRRGPAER